MKHFLKDLIIDNFIIKLRAKNHVIIMVLLRIRMFATITAQKRKFSIKDFFSKCDQIRRKLWIWSHLLKKSLMENFIFRAAHNTKFNSCYFDKNSKIFRKTETLLFTFVLIYLFFISSSTIRL